MCALEAPLGSSALLRVAGLPIRYWLAGASPGLFAKVRSLECTEQGRRAFATEMAERIGNQLVPHPALSREDRAFLLDLRRRLHRGGLLATVSRERLVQVTALAAGGEELTQALAALVDGDRATAALSEEIEGDLAREHERLLTLPEQIAVESRVASALLTAAHTVDRDAEELSRKSRRHRSEHAWRRISRAATSGTPRGWLSHVALVAIETQRLPPPVVSHLFTAQWAENVRAPRLALADPPDEWPTPETRLAVNPLRWEADGRLVCVVLDKNREQTQVSVQRSPLLNLILAAMNAATPTFGELADAVGCADKPEWLALRGFVRHLTVLGIVQSSRPPLVRVERQATPGETFAHEAGAGGDHGGWVDVYRYAGTGVSRSVADDVQRGLSQALRLLSMTSRDIAPSAPWPPPTSARSWSLSEILRDDLAIGDAPTPPGEDAEDAGGPSPESPRLARLISELVEQAGSAHEVVIDSARLDEWGASSPTLTWPIDCLVRLPAPGSSFTAVVEDTRPAGVLDARFADTLSELHGEVPQVEAYRAFLRRLEQLTGILFVEVLVPPLTDGAANAVRRPIYTRAWTGDPHADAYLRDGASRGTYIPLNEIAIRRVAGRLRAEVGGQPIWPLYHATRTFEHPWSRVARVLLAAGPVDLPGQCERITQVLGMLHALLPARAMMPRISLSEGLVLSPAQWRLRPDQMWDRDAPAQTKLRALVRLRDRYALPRWVYLQRNGHQSRVPCDLESLHVFRTVERCTTPREPVRVVEMLPAPDQLIVVDGAHRSGDRLVSQLHLRFPCDESPTDMANRIAPAVLAALGPPGTQAQRSAVPTQAVGR